MMTSFAIQNFKGFQELDLPQLSRITLIGGQNNVGKTSVMEAMFMFHDRLNPNLILRQFAWRGVGAVVGNFDTLWAPIYRNYDTHKEITLSAVIEDSTETLTLRLLPSRVSKAIPVRASRSSGEGPYVNGVPTDQRANLTQVLELAFRSGCGDQQVSHLTLSQEGLQLEASGTVSPPRPAAFFPSRMHIDAAEEAARFGQLDLVGRQDVIVNFLQVIEPRLRGLSTVAVGNTPVIHGDIGLGRKIPVALMGDGMSRLLSVVLGIANSQNGFVFVDEFENGIHYSAMSKVWHGVAQAAREFNCQVIGTTHSYECLQAAREGFSGRWEEDFTYVRLDRVEGNIVAKTFDYTLLRSSLNAEMEVR
jgi:hypothetical protein